MSARLLYHRRARLLVLQQSLDRELGWSGHGMGLAWLALAHGEGQPMSQRLFQKYLNSDICGCRVRVDEFGNP